MGFDVSVYNDTYYYVVHSIIFQPFLVHAFKIGVDSWEFSMLLLYILWDDWPISMISGSKNSYSSKWNTLYEILIVTAAEFQKCYLDVRKNDMQ